MTIGKTNASLGDIQSELGGSNPISMSEYYAGGGITPSGTQGTGGAIPTSGQINMGRFRQVAGSSFFNTTFTVDGATADRWMHHDRYVRCRADLDGNPPDRYDNSDTDRVYQTDGRNVIPEWSNNKVQEIFFGYQNFTKTTDSVYSMGGNFNSEEKAGVIAAKQFIVPMNASYCIVEGWGAGGGGGYGWYNASSNGGGGGYCRSYLYVGSHINGGDVITIATGIPGAAGPWLTSGCGGGGTAAFVHDPDYLTYSQAYGTAYETQPGVVDWGANDTNGTMSGNKRGALNIISQTINNVSGGSHNNPTNGDRIIFCAGGGGGGGASNWGWGVGHHGGGAGVDGTAGRSGVSASNTRGNQYSHGTGALQASQNNWSGSYNGTESNWTATSADDTDDMTSDAYQWWRICHPMMGLYPDHNESGYQAMPASGGGGAWASLPGHFVYVSNQSYAGSRGAGGGSVGVYKGQSTAAYNGSGTSPGTTSGSLVSISSNHAYGGSAGQYSSSANSNRKFGSSGKPGYAAIKFYS
jgi:hypothetical protein